MKPGRELDALVAEKVIGRKIRKNFAQGILVRMYFDEAQGADVPYYSTSIADAWEVVEKLRTDNTDTQGWFTLQEDTEGWEAGWGDWVPYEGFEFNISEKAHTAPLAICLAALKACGVSSFSPAS